MTTDAEAQQITHVAISYAGRIWSLPAPNRHHDVIRLIAKETGAGMYGPHSEGFLTENGTYLDRRSARWLAASTGQFKRAAGGTQSEELFSEDLW